MQITLSAAKSAAGSVTSLGKVNVQQESPKNYHVKLQIGIQRLLVLFRHCSATFHDCESDQPAACDAVMPFFQKQKLEKRQKHPSNNP